MKSHESKNDTSVRNVEKYCHQYRMGVWIFHCLNLVVIICKIKVKPAYKSCDPYK